MLNLEQLLKRLEETGGRGEKYTGRYFIPEAWNFADYTGGEEVPGYEGQLDVDPVAFCSHVIRTAILSRAKKDKSYLKALEIDKPEMTDIAKSNIYSMLPRMFSAWDHRGDGTLCTGTFLKTICLLPYLKRLDIDVIYLMPLFEYSMMYRKGETGSPYSIKNMYMPDRNLHDALLGKNDADIFDVEFKAFIEACHILGMRVMVDFVFRTVARDNDLMIEHPEWFYWIDMKYVESFASFRIDRLKRQADVNVKNVDYLYKSPHFPTYVAQFTRSPRELDPQKWAQVYRRHKDTGENMLELIQQAYGITTLPGFADVLNAEQPPWTDVTYLKFYNKPNPRFNKYSPEGQAAFIMQDSVKLSLFPGEEPITELWDYFAGAIPYYQINYGIDGARIDMGHALPTELNKEIVARVKKNNRNFLLWSEEFETRKAGHAKEEGFHFISGSVFAVFKKLEKPSFNKLLMDALITSELPVAAALETPDTPRIAFVQKDRRRLRQVMLINALIPNAVPFINNGMEVMEIQPMNLGLDNTEAGRLVLPEDDPMYGKLAFFDHYALHWQNSEREWMEKLLQQAFGLRRRFADIISKRENFVNLPGLYNHPKLTLLCYHDKDQHKTVFLLANRDFRSRAKVIPGKLLPEDVVEGDGTMYYHVFGGDDSHWNHDSGDKSSSDQSSGDIAGNIFDIRYMEPGEVLAGFMNK